MPYCPRCDELWREYTEKANIHIQAVTLQELAARDGDFEAFRQLEAAVREAEADRARARKATANHERVAHSGAPFTRSAGLQ